MRSQYQDVQFKHFCNTIYQNLVPLCTFCILYSANFHIHLLIQKLHTHSYPKFQIMYLSYVLCISKSIYLSTKTFQICSLKKFHHGTKLVIFIAHRTLQNSLLYLCSLSDHSFQISCSIRLHNTNYVIFSNCKLFSYLPVRFFPYTFSFPRQTYAQKFRG